MVVLNKRVLALIVAVGMLVTSALFIGIGFGFGALSVTSPSTSGAPDYVQTNYTEVSSMFFAVSITSYSSAGVIPTTALNPNGQSTSFDVSVSMWDPTGDNCANSGQPTFAPGSGSNFGELQVTYGSPFTLIVGGQQEVSSGDSYVIPFFTNGPGISTVYACSNLDGADHVYGYSPTPEPISSTDFTLQGTYSPSRITMTFIGEGTYCDNIFGTGTQAPACTASDNAVYGVTGYHGATGNFNIDASAAINTWSGQAWVTNAAPGAVVYNGGTATFSVSTGFDGNGNCPYTLQMNTPSARGNTTDTNFKPICVPNFYKSTESFTIPAGTSQISSTPGWNEFIGILSASGGPGYVEGYTIANIDISPTYQPTDPTILAHSDGKFVNPQIGDTEVITIFGNQSASSGTLESINLIVYYATTSEPAGALPSCGAQWVSTVTCPGGITASAMVYGSGLEATFSFEVNPPQGMTGIWIQSFSESTKQQASNSTFLWVSITPSDCKPGVAGCPTGSAQSLWELIGPILLSILIVLAGIEAALWIPAWYFRVLVIVLPIALVIALYALGGYTALFISGGFLNNGAG